LSGKHVFGLEESIVFGRSRQGNTTGGRDSVTLTANKATIGPYIEEAFLRRAAPNWRLIIRPLDYSSNLSRTVTTINGAPDATGNATSFTEDLPALRSLASRGGLRFEAPQRKDSLLASEGNSFVEFGYQSTWSLNAPTELTLNPGTPFATPCSLITAELSLSSCAKSVVAVSPAAVISQIELNRQNGVYWTALFRVPLGKSLTYKLGTDGEFRQNNASSAEARYAVTLDNYLAGC
jgi:hypothetical protein